MYLYRVIGTDDREAEECGRDPATPWEQIFGARD